MVEKDHLRETKKNGKIRKYIDVILENLE